MERLHAELIEEPQRRAAEAGFPPVHPKVDWSEMDRVVEQLMPPPASPWTRGELTAEQRRAHVPDSPEAVEDPTTWTGPEVGLGDAQDLGEFDAVVGQLQADLEQADREHPATPEEKK